MIEKSCDRLGASCSRYVDGFRVENGVDRAFKDCSVEIFKCGSYLAYVGLHNRLENIVSAKALFCYFNSLIGGKSGAYELLYGFLKFGISLVAERACESDYGRLGDTRNARKLRCGKISCLIVVVEYCICYFLSNIYKQWRIFVKNKRTSVFYNIVISCEYSIFEMLVPQNYLQISNNYNLNKSNVYTS